MTHRSAASVCVRGGELCEPVLVRVLGALAARADLPVDRLSDAQVVAGAIAQRAPRYFPDGAIHMTFSYAPATIRLAIGPLVPGGAQRLLEDTAVAGIGPVLERIADEVDAQVGADGDTLLLTIGTSAEVTA